jgi:hypothetical protein
MEKKHNSLQSRGYSYEVTIPDKDSEIEISEKLVDGVSRGIRRVLEKHGLGGKREKIAFTDGIRDGDGNYLRSASMYIPDQDLFAVAVWSSTFLTLQTQDLDDEMLGFLLGAHEAQHKVQCNSDNRPSLLPRGIDEDDTTDFHEQDAWREAMEAFKAEFPDIEELELQFNGVTYTLPEESKYMKK